MNKNPVSPAKLNKENKQTIRKMKMRLGAYQLNPVAYRELLKDITGMALESQERGEAFSDTVGMDYSTFCSELVRNEQRQSLPEKLLGLFLILLECIAIIMPGLFLYTLLFPGQLATTSGPMLTISVWMLLKYIFIGLVLLAMWTAVKRSMYHGAPWLFALFVPVFMLIVILADNLALSDWFVHMTVEVNFWIWMGIFICSIAACLVCKFLLAKHNYNKKK